MKQGYDSNRADAETIEYQFKFMALPHSNQFTSSCLVVVCFLVPNSNNTITRTITSCQMLIPIDPLRCGLLRRRLRDLVDVVHTLHQVVCVKG